MRQLTQAPDFFTGSSADLVAQGLLMRPRLLLKPTIRKMSDPQYKYNLAANRVLGYIVSRNLTRCATPYVRNRT